MNPHEKLDAAELEALRRYANDQQDVITERTVLARLEKLGLLMHGWGHTHVVTQRGLEILRDNPQ